MNVFQELEVMQYSKGNPGAINVMVAGLRHHGDEFLNRISKLSLFGPDIWTLFKDDCGEDIAVMFDRMGEMEASK